MRCRFKITLVILLSFKLFSIEQTKFSKVSVGNEGVVNIDSIPTKLVPFHNYELYYSKKYRRASKEGFVVIEGKEVKLLPYLVIDDKEYLGFKSKTQQIIGKPSYLAVFQGKETLLLSTGDLVKNTDYYPGLEGRPSNHVYVDDQEFVFIRKSEFASYLAKYSGINGLPANYVYLGQEMIIVVPVADDHPRAPASLKQGYMNDSEFVEMKYFKAK